MNYDREKVETLGKKMNEIMYQEPVDIFIVKYTMVCVLEFHSSKAVEILYKQPQKVIDHIYITDNVPKLEFNGDMLTSDAIDFVTNHLGLTYGVIDVSFNANNKDFK